MKKAIASFLFLCVWTAGYGTVVAMDIDCDPQYREDIDDSKVLDYQGSLRKSVPLKKDGCERKEGLIVADSSYMDYFGMVHYVPLYYVADKGEADSKFNGLLFPLDITAEIEEDTKHEDYRYSRFSVRVKVRQTGNELIWFDEDSPSLVKADKKSVSLIYKGVGHGGASYGASMQTVFGLTPENMRDLLDANKYIFIVPFMRRSEKGKVKFTIQLNLTNEGSTELKKFLKVALKYAETNKELDKKYGAK